MQILLFSFPIRKKKINQPGNRFELSTKKNSKKSSLCLVFIGSMYHGALVTTTKENFKKTMQIDVCI